MAKAIQSAQVDLVLRKLANARTVNNRVEILKTNDTPILRKVMTYAYNPYIKFGIKLDKTSRLDLISLCHRNAGLDIDDQEIWDLLDEFKVSTQSSANKLARLKTLFPRLDMNTGYILLGILEKTVVKGVSESTVNKAWPHTIPVFSVQLAAKYTDKKIKSFPQYVEIKYDGIRATTLIHATGDIEVLTRTGRPIPAAKYFQEELAQIGKAYAKVVDEPQHRIFTGCVTDGELTGENFNQAVSTFRSDEVATSGSYQLFDILPMEVITDETFKPAPYKERRQTLAKVMWEANVTATAKAAPLTKVLLSSSYIANSKAEIWAYYNGARAQGLEGVIVKDPEGLWEPKRSNAWLKIKAEETADLRIIGAFEGEGEKEGTLGGLIVEGTIDGRRIEARVGSGFSDEDSDLIWAMFLRDLERHEAGSDDFELIGCLCEVQYQEITPDNSLRHPVYVRMRNDKNEVSF